MYPEVLDAVHKLRQAVESDCGTVNAKKVTAAHAVANALSKQNPVIAGLAAKILDDCFPRDRNPNVDLEKLDSITEALCHGGRGLSWYTGEKLYDDLGL
ncbi:hypothetical protein ACYZT4_10625 [Pseudomonas sp. GB2N2]